jgi:hypothetical protein
MFLQSVFILILASFSVSLGDGGWLTASLTGLGDVDVELVGLTRR